MDNLFLSLLMIILAYLSGSVCSAIIVCRVFGLPDPRTEGSKNPGATNVLRLAGKHYAAVVLLGDVLKGTVPLIIAHFLKLDANTLSLCCLAAVVGHMYPVFFQFKGGKGVATALGAMLGLHLMLGIVVIAIWLLIANFFRYSSLASIVSMLLAPFLSIVTTGHLYAFFPLLMITALILYKHRNNINRLIDGEEPKLDFKKNQLASLTDEILEPTNNAVFESEIPQEVVADVVSESQEPVSETKPIRKKTKRKKEK